MTHTRGHARAVLACRTQVDLLGHRLAVLAAGGESQACRLALVLIDDEPHRVAADRARRRGTREPLGENAGVPDLRLVSRHDDGSLRAPAPF
ncbi:MAG TPA: hypothetical protein PLU35_09095 [Phycisphaerales bacterium]|nr:hypothetical protein [Phycisphaerales bacterium]